MNSSLKRLVLLLPLTSLACTLLNGTLATPTHTPADTPLIPPTSTSSAIPTITPSPEPTFTPTLPPPAGLPDPQAFEWVLIADGLVAPVDLQNAGDARLFVIEQGGVIRIVRGGELLPEPFLDLRDRVNASGSERGLLGLAFHPDFAGSGLFFVNYTGAEGASFISRFSLSPNPDRADPSSEVNLLRVAQPYRNHNGGGLAFGPDGYLYIGLGDGGSAGDPLGNGQRLDTFLGKMLRVDVDAGDPYAIPPDNPFADGGGLPEIWAYGLRNPWRFAFDSLTGSLFIGDVGQGNWEEIDFQPARAAPPANYGWNLREGMHEFAGGEAPEVVDPVTEYSHAQGCSVTGGIVVRDPTLPEWQGVFLYGDYCSGLIWGLLQGGGGWHSDQLFDTHFSVSGFGTDHEGAVYVVDYGGGVYRLARRP